MIELLFILLACVFFGLATFGIAGRWNFVAAGLLSLTIGVWLIPMIH